MVGMRGLVQSARDAAYLKRRALRARWVERRILRNAGGPIVRGGPFDGMRFTTDCRWPWFPTYLTGAYEAELHDALERFIDSEPDIIVDVGCAEGYYAVGLALRLPRAHVYAYDIDQHGRDTCSAVAAANGVADRVTVREACTLDDLRELCGPSTLILMDCEGAEVELFNPSEVPALAQTHAIIELHHFIDPSIPTTLEERAQANHDVDFVTASIRNSRPPVAESVLKGFNERDRLWILDEERLRTTDPMRWLVATPRLQPLTGTGTAPSRR
jgi:hypothetical protein